MPGRLPARLTVSPSHGEPACRSSGNDPNAVDPGIMSPFLKFLLRRLLTIPITLFVITAALYGMLMFSPPDERRTLLPDRLPSHFTEEDMQRLTEKIIREHGLHHPDPVQHPRRASGLLRGQWGTVPCSTGTFWDVASVRRPRLSWRSTPRCSSFRWDWRAGRSLPGNRTWGSRQRISGLLAFVGTSIPPFYPRPVAPGDLRCCPALVPSHAAGRAPGLARPVLGASTSTPGS